MMEHLKTRQRGGPGLALVPGAPVEAPSREASATRPLAVFALKFQQSGAPALRGHAGALGCEDVIRRADEITQNLPSKRGVRLEQPV